MCFTQNCFYNTANNRYGSINKAEETKANQNRIPPFLQYCTQTNTYAWCINLSYNFILWIFVEVSVIVYILEHSLDTKTER